MSVVDRNVIDIMLVEDNKCVLVICDHLEWNYFMRNEHAHILQDKINDYLDYIASGQAEKAKPGLRPVIRIIAKYSYSKYCIDFLDRVKNYVKEKDNICDIEWTHEPTDETYNDGFSDDYVFQPEKIFPRLRKNWAKNPLEEILLTSTTSMLQEYPDNLVLFRYWESFVGIVMVDAGNKFVYFTYDMLPKNMSVEQLQDIAFDNLLKNIEYRYCETKEQGVYGIVAGGDFEAESICLGIWDELANKLGDDLVISIPTKDIVYFTKLNDKKLKNKMLKMAKKMYQENRKESPYLIFCEDVFIYSRDNKEIVVSSEYSL